MISCVLVLRRGGLALRCSNMASNKRDDVCDGAASEIAHAMILAVVLFTNLITVDVLW